MTSYNNLAINAYPENIYDKVAGMFTFTRVVVFCGLGVFLLGLIRGKVVGLELTHVLQLAYFGLIVVKKGDPLFYPMK